ncbi:MAG: ATP phosphoribosyltransferase [Phycisphaeraceae bacterium]|nr:MAG: ATP phosphoribosyltransferase [Phycisphaeraceae bacterium]
MNDASPSTAAAPPPPTPASAPATAAPPISLAIPKGRQSSQVERLLADAGWAVRGDERDYRPTCAAPGVIIKRLKSQNIPQLLEAGRHDIGFAGADWVRETGADVDEILDLETDPVRIVAAAPRNIAESLDTPRELVIATEYVRLAEQWAAARKLDARIIRTHGATEVFPPEDADLIIDNTASGSTLRANGLVIIDELMRSSTRLFARPGLRENPEFMRLVDDLVVLLRASLAARGRVMLELNVSDDLLDAVIDRLPSMRAPTVSQLWGAAAHAVKSAVPRDDLPALIPDLRRIGATDIVVYQLERICP